MSLRDEIDADFSAILKDGLSATLSFGRDAGGDVCAMVEETTLGAELTAGGTRLSRSFSATVRLAAFRGGVLPRPGGRVFFDGVSYRIASVKKSPEHPLVRVGFSKE